MFITLKFICQIYGGLILSSLLFSMCTNFYTQKTPNEPTTDLQNITNNVIAILLMPIYIPYRIGRYIYYNFDLIVDKFIVFGKNILDLVTNLYTYLRNKFGVLCENILHVLRFLFNIYKKVVKAYLNIIERVVKYFLNKFTIFCENMWHTLKYIFTIVFNTIERVVKAFWDKFGVFLKYIWYFYKIAIKYIWNCLMEMLINISNLIVDICEIININIIKPIARFTIDKINNIITVCKEILIKFKNMLEWCIEMVSRFANYAEYLLNKYKLFMIRLCNTIFNFCKYIYNNIIMTHIVPLFKKLITAIITTYHQISEILELLWSLFVDYVIYPIKRIIIFIHEHSSNIIYRAYTFCINILSNVYNEIKKVLLEKIYEIKNTMQIIFSEIRVIINKLIHNIHTIYNNIANNLIIIFNNITLQLTTKINDIITISNNIIESLQNTYDNLSISINNILNIFYPKEINIQNKEKEL